MTEYHQVPESDCCDQMTTALTYGAIQFDQYAGKIVVPVKIPFGAGRTDPLIVNRCPFCGVEI